jgi:DNA-binding LacI/PurR family transcriptional regulator
VAANDLMAIGAQNYLSSAGVKIPSEMAIIGFDNIEMSESIRPSLSTMDYPIEKMSERIIDLILQQIKNPDSQSEMVQLYPQLIVRESSDYKRDMKKTEGGAASG